jgi:hypothetical protein
MEKEHYTLVFKSQNGTGINNNSLQYYIDTTTLKKCPYKASFVFNSEGNNVTSYSSPYNQVFVNMDLGQNRTLMAGSGQSFLNNNISKLLGGLKPSPIISNTATYYITAIRPLYNITASAVPNLITLNSTANLYVGMSILTAGTTFGGIATATTYVIESIIDATTITLVGLTVSAGTGAMTFLASIVNNVIVNTTVGLSAGNSVIVTGATSGALVPGTYIISSVLSPNIIIFANSPTLTTVNFARMWIQVGNMNILYADSLTNPPVYLTGPPSSNLLQIDIVDKNNNLFIDNNNNNVSNYTLALSLDEI